MNLVEPLVQFEVRGAGGFVTLNRPRALNALSLDMIRLLSAQLSRWQTDPKVAFVAIRGMGREGPFGSFCAGGDIRFFHEAALAGNAQLGDFFTEEYALNHLIHTYTKPYIAFMDGIVMGGGMGLCGHGGQGTKLRLVTGRTKMAMPETNIGLFPDVGGGYFLSRCPGRTGEWLALTGDVIGAGEALAFGLADACFDPNQLAPAWESLSTLDIQNANALANWLATFSIAAPAHGTGATGQIDQYFSRSGVKEIVQALEADTSAWAQHTAATLRKRSPLMQHVALEQVRRARTLTLASDLRMERDMVQHCFDPQHLSRSAAQSDTVEGMRALVIDKDNSAQGNPARIDDVTPAMVEPFFTSPWTAETHPLRQLG